MLTLSNEKENNKTADYKIKILLLSQEKGRRNKRKNKKIPIKTNKIN